MSSKKVGVLMGGLSKEREISLRSGRAVAKALLGRGHDVVEIDVADDIAERLKKEKIDVAFIALHGRYGEDGTIQGLLEWMKIPYTGSGPVASGVGIDKDLTKRLVTQAGIRTPAWKTFRRGEWRKLTASPLPLPVIIKPNREGSTIGMGIVRDASSFVAALGEAGRFDDAVLVEQFIEGREVTVGILDGQALPVLEVIPKGGFYDYRSKYTPGMTEYVVPARIPEPVRLEVTEASEKIGRLLDLTGVARLDFMIGRGDQSWFLEVNTIPGMTELSLVPKAAAAVGIDFGELCDRILAGAGLKV